jgi:hypothetical protein
MKHPCKSGCFIKCEKESGRVAGIAVIESSSVVPTPIGIALAQLLPVCAIMVLLTPSNKHKIVNVFSY